jgi:O-antigen ligase
MNGIALSLRRPDLVVRVAAALAGTGLLAALAALLAVVLWRYPPPFPLALAGGLGILAILALALARYEAAVTLGILLSGVARWEPAPADAVLAVVIAVALATGRFHLNRIPLEVMALIGLFFVLNVISASEALDPTEAARFFSITLYLGIFGIWFTSYVRSRRQTRSVVRAYLVIAVVSAVLGSLAVLLHFPGYETFTSYKDRGRADALFKDPNVFGPFLIPIALIVIEEILDPRLLRSSRVTKLGLVVLLSVGVLFSYSRAAWLNLTAGLVVMLVVFAFRRGGGRKAIVLLSLLIALTAVLTTTVAVTGSVHFLEKRARFQTYDTGRFGTQEAGVELAERHPLGIGPGQFEKIEPRSPHSTYVRALTEQGILGFVAVLALLLLTLGLAARNAVRGRDTFGVGSAALLGAWCGILLNSAFVDTYHWRHLWLVGALIWAGAMRPGPAWEARVRS